MSELISNSIEDCTSFDSALLIPTTNFILYNLALADFITKS